MTLLRLDDPSVEDLAFFTHEIEFRQVALPVDVSCPQRLSTVKNTNQASNPSVTTSCKQISKEPKSLPSKDVLALSQLGSVVP